jgi:hypothetical protein
MASTTVFKKYQVAKKEMAKAAWYYLDGLRECSKKMGRAPTEEEVDVSWEDYKAAQTTLSKLEKQLDKIRLAKIDVDKASWWMDEGVKGESHLEMLSLMFPHDMDAMLDEAIMKARDDYDRANRALAEVESSVESSPELAPLKSQFSMPLPLPLPQTTKSPLDTEKQWEEETCDGCGTTCECDTPADSANQIYSSQLESRYYGGSQERQECLKSLEIAEKDFRNARNSLFTR